MANERMTSKAVLYANTSATDYDDADDDGEMWNYNERLQYNEWTRNRGRMQMMDFKNDRDT
jgi:hypothetical protein